MYTFYFWTEIPLESPGGFLIISFQKGNNHTKTLKKLLKCLINIVLFLLRQMSVFPFSKTTCTTTQAWSCGWVPSHPLLTCTLSEKRKNTTAIWLSNFPTSSHSIRCAYNVIKTPTDCCSSSGKTLRKWPVGLNLSLTFHSCEEWMFLKVKLAPVFVFVFCFFSPSREFKVCLVLLSVRSFLAFFGPPQRRRCKQCLLPKTSSSAAGSVGVLVSGNKLWPTFFPPSFFRLQQHPPPCAPRTCPLTPCIITLMSWPHPWNTSQDK